MSRVMVQTSDAYFSRTGNPLCIPDKSFAEYIESAAPALVLIDPLQSFLPAGVETGQRQPDAGRPAAPQGPLRAAGLRSPTCRHAHQQALQRLGPSARLADSSDIWDIARSVLMMGRDKKQRPARPQPREEQLRRPGPHGPAPHRADAGGRALTTAVAVFDSRTDKKDADFVEERRVRVAQTKADAAQAHPRRAGRGKAGQYAQAPSSGARGGQGDGVQREDL